MDTSTITPPPQGPPPGAVATPIDTGASAGPPPGAVATPIASTPPASTGVMGWLKNKFSDAAQNDPELAAPIGAVKSLGSGVGGLLKIMGQYGVVPLTDQAQHDPGAAANDLKEAGDWLQQHGQEHGLWQHVGGAGEMIGELLNPFGGEEEDAARAMTYTERMGQQLKTAKFLQENPRIAKLAAVGARAVHAALKAGAETGAQTFVHTGGDTDAATTAAGVGAAGGAVLTPAAEGVSALLRRIAPAVETIAGEEVPTLSSQRPGTGARGSVKLGETPKVAAAQQTAAPRAFRNLAQRATRAALDEANKGRIPPGLITDPARLLQASEEARPYAFTIPGTTPVEGTEGEIAQPAAKRAQAAFKPPSYVTSSAEAPTVPGVEGSTGSDVATSTPREPGRDVAAGGGDLIAADPETAQMHLSRLNDVIDHPPRGTTPEQLQAITEARDSLQEQMGVYHSYQRTLPNFQPIDAGRAAASVGSFGEAADQLQNAAQPIYQKIDEATNGQFGDLNRSRGAAIRRGDFLDARKYESGIQQLIEQTGAISPAERVQASKLWSQSMILDGLHNVVEHAANVDDAYSAQVSGGRVLTGYRMQKGLQRMIRDYGSDRIESVIGKDGMENMTRLADLLQVPEKRPAIQHMSLSLLHNIMNGKVGGALGGMLGHQIAGWEGAVAGSYAGAQAERMVLRILATSPQAGKLFDYAIRNNVTPKIATGLITSALVKEHEDAQPQGEHLSSSDNDALGTKLTAQALRESGASGVYLHMPADWQTRPLSPDLENRIHDQSTTPPLLDRVKEGMETFGEKTKAAVHAVEGKKD
jgi:hypothetical protein